jgi:hypothetical protein
MASEHDLTGRWTGIFNYPSSDPPNSFEAVLRDVGGAITGLTTELDDDPYGSGGVLHAVIEGHRTGSIVTFTKIYDELEPEPIVISYDGIVDAGGDEIEGQWERPGVWSGTFLMVRSGGVEKRSRAKQLRRCGPVKSAAP